MSETTTVTMTVAPPVALEAEPLPYPKLFPALTKRRVVVEHRRPELECLFLMRGGTTPPRQAYRKLGVLGSGDIPISNRRDLFKCQVLPFVRRQQDDKRLVFREPNDDDEYPMVAVKRIKRWILNPVTLKKVFEPWANWTINPVTKRAIKSLENPHAEIAAMQRLNPRCDMDHAILGCIEALQDDNYIYIVMPLVENGDLHRHIPWYRGCLSEEVARIVMSKIVKKVLYLHERGICHGDLKGENILMRVTNRTQDATNIAAGDGAKEQKPTPIQDMEPTLFDLAQSFKVPQRNGLFQQVQSRGQTGTEPFMPPEIYHCQSFRAFEADVWALGIIYFQLLTGKPFCEKPQDECYKHFVERNGFMNHELNQPWLDKFEHLLDMQQPPTFPPDYILDLVSKIKAVEGLGPTARIVLSGMLESDPTKRFTLSQVQTWLSS